MAQEIKSFIPEGFDPYNCSIEELKAKVQEMHDKEDFFESKQLGEKLFLNSMYGACSSKYFVGFNLEVSKSITLQGQDLNHFSENSVNEYFNGIFQNDTELHQKLGITTEAAQRVKIDRGGINAGGVHHYTDSEKEKLGLTHLPDDKTMTVAGDTDSCASTTICYLDSSPISISSMFTELKYENNDTILKIPNGSEIVPVKNHTTKSFSFENGVCDKPIKYVMRHKVSKSKWKLKTKSGKEIFVTGDHSLIVLRDGQMLPLKAKDVNPKTDRIITIKND